MLRNNNKMETLKFKDFRTPLKTSHNANLALPIVLQKNLILSL